MIALAATTFLTSPEFVWTATLALYLAGLAGCIFPILPGHLLIFLAMLGNHWILGAARSGISWWFVAAMAVLFALCQAAEFFMSSAGSTRFGGSRWGAIGALIGTLIGLFFFPFGLLLGPLLGAFFAELIFQKSTLRQAGKSGFGSMLGNLSSIVLKVAIALVAIYAHIAFAWPSPT